MAESISIKIPSKELEHFSRDLFNYIWQAYRVNCQSLDEAFNQMLKNDKEYSNESEVISPFNEDIGVAVLHSQFLLRDYCCFYFKCYLKHYQGLTNCIYAIINNWMTCRTNVFHTVVDCAAIVAESFLYCFIELNKEIDLSFAPLIFMQIFHSLTNLELQFFGNGGWKGLQERSYEDFIYFKIRLMQFVNFRMPKYDRLDYNCELIEVLLNSQVLYPVEISKICDNCLLPSKTEIFTVTITPVTSKQESGEKSSEDVSPQEESSKDDPSQEDALNDSMSKCQITQSYKKVLDEEVEIFRFRLGRKCRGRIQAVNVENKAEKSSNKKSKAKS